MLDATIILPNYNNERVLPFTFAYLRTRLDCSQLHFVLVDDGSEDASVAVAKAEAATCGFASVQILETPHRGIVFALNDALAAARTEFIVRIDGDATVESHDWVARMVGMLRHDEIGLVGGHVIWESGRVHSLGRSVFSEWGLFDMGACPLEPPGGRTFDSIVYRPFTSFANAPPYEVDTALGVCVAFRRAEALAVRGFDVQFNPVWIEDDDFGLSIRSLGKRVVIDPHIQVVHRPSLRGSRQPGVESRQLWSSGQTRTRLRSLLRAGKNRAGAIARSVRGDALDTTTDSHLPRERNPWRTTLLTQHYAAWGKKWGFDPLNPDMLAVAQRYWETPFCWRLNPSQHAASQSFLERLADTVP